MLHRILSCDIYHFTIWSFKMSVLQKIFQTKRATKSHSSKCSSVDLCTQWPNLKLNHDQIRLILFIDDIKGRQFAYDSKTIKKLDPQKAYPDCCSKTGAPIPDRKKGCFKNQPKQPMFQFLKQSSDVKVLEEMVFGSVPMTFQGPSSKVHFIRSPQQLMLTKVFVPEKVKRESLGGTTVQVCSVSLWPRGQCPRPQFYKAYSGILTKATTREYDVDSSTCSYQSNVTDASFCRQISGSDELQTGVAHSIPVDVPFHHSFSKDLDSIEDDSGLASITSSGSFTMSYPSPDSSISGSYNSLHRRWMRSLHTSLDPTLRKRGSLDLLQGMPPLESSPVRKSKITKIGIGIIFNLSEDEEENNWFQNFFFAHVPLFESHLLKLQSDVQRAYNNRRVFLNIISEAVETFRREILDLYTAPRLSEPVWLSMMTHSSYRYILCEKFIQEFMWMISKFENKNTNFFVSTLLTAVLAHHLAWVPTVTPAGGTPSPIYLDKHSAKWIDMLSKTHPYNPLWAQLGDLYGALGYPLKIAKTVVLGKKADLVQKILYILSYFIRCSDVRELIQILSLKKNLDEVNFDITPTDSEKTIGSPTCLSEKYLFSRSTSPNSVYSQSEVSSPVSDGCWCDLHHKQSSKPGQTTVNKNFNCRCMALQTGDNLAVCNHKLKDKSSDESEMHLMNLINLNCCDNYNKNDSKLVKPQRNDNDYECKVISHKIVEDAKVEVAKNVHNAVGEHSHPMGNSAAEICDNVNTQKTKSKLTNLIENSQNCKLSLEDTHHDMKKMFLKEGSMSMFEEYFNEDIITKTIDEIDEINCVIDHPLIRDKLRHKSSDQESIGDFDRNQEVEELCRRKSFSRQLSIDKSQKSRPTSLPGRCRSVTPTELGRRKHLSSSSSYEMDLNDLINRCYELPMPRFDVDATSISIKSYEQNFGRSLLAGFSDHYMCDFVLHGTSDPDYEVKMMNDLQTSAQNTVLDEPINEMCCIIADIDKCTVKLASSKGTISPCVPSQLVCNLLESVTDISKLKMSPEFCLMHLEDRLQEIYFKSKMMAEYMRTVKLTSIRELSSLLGFETSDLSLLCAVTSTHSPNLALGIVNKLLKFGQKKILGDQKSVPVHASIYRHDNLLKNIPVMTQEQGVQPFITPVLNSSQQNGLENSIE